MWHSLLDDCGLHRLTVHSSRCNCICVISMCIVSWLICSLKTGSWCSRLFSASDSTTEYWKQLRRESLGRRHEGSKSLRSTSIMTKPAESNTKQSTFGEVAGRLLNFHESAKALATCLRTGDITRQADPNMIEAAKHLHHKLLREASDNLERVLPQPCESSLAE